MNTIASKPTPRIDRHLLFLSLACLVITGCPSNQPANNPPTVNAGDNQVVNAGDNVTLDGSASSDPEGKAIGFSWKQTLGSPVSLSDTSQPVVTFTAPAKSTTLGFELTVNDGQSDSVGKVGVSVQLVDPLVNVEARLQRSVTEDPFVLGNIPQDWLFADAGNGLPGPPTTENPDIGDEPELSEFLEQLEDSQTPGLVEDELSPGATRTVSLTISEPSGLAASVRWIGTISPLKVTLALDGNTLATGTAYHFGLDRGGSYLQAQATDRGQATVSVTNTSDVKVKVRIVFEATGLGGE